MQLKSFSSHITFVAYYVAFNVTVKLTQYMYVHVSVQTLICSSGNRDLALFWRIILEIGVLISLGAKTGILIFFGEYVGEIGIVFSISGKIGIPICSGEYLGRNWDPDLSWRILRAKSGS